MSKDYYQTLGVSREATESDIKKAYRRLATQWHPDKHQQASPDEQKVAEEKFKEISEAYAILSDPESKQRYDLSGDPTFRNFSPNPEDIFAHIFGFRRRPAGPRPLQGQTIRLQQMVPLSAILLGDEIPIVYQVSSPCADCSGTGAAELDLCEDCKGSGFVTSHQANMVIQQSCNTCRGSGKKAKVLCSVCAGRAFRIEERSLSVVVPPGLPPGAVLRLAGQGGKGLLGGPPGDVLIEIQASMPDLSGLSPADKESLRRLLGRVD